MAERRMFSKRLVNSSRFIKMPISTQCLYFHLGLQADDDGIVEAYNVMRATGCTEDDLRVLASKGFVQVLNEDLVTYILDWNENNYIRPDRKIDSIYKGLLLQIMPDANLVSKRQRADVKSKCIEENDKWTTNGQPMDSIGKDRIGKDRIGKDRIGKVSIGKESIGKSKTAKRYFDFPELNDAFLDFLDMRKKKRVPNTDRAIKLVISKLNKYAVLPFEDSLNEKMAIDMLNESIEHGWTSVYPLKEDKNTVKQSQSFEDKWRDA